MNRYRNWDKLEVPPIEALPKAILPRSQTMLPGQRFPDHHHDWHQFVYATSGTLAVTVLTARYVISPGQALWVPAGIEHSAGALNGVEFRNLYVSDLPDLMMPSECTVFSVSPLLHELIAELDFVYDNEADEPYADALVAMVFQQLTRLPSMDFYLPWPQSPMLRTICEVLFEDPADARSLEEWGGQLGASGRTITRRFEKETGMSLRDWRFRLRLFLAVEWLGSRRSVTQIALDLGYSSTSAFTYMFRKEMGFSPSEWRTR